MSIAKIEGMSVRYGSYEALDNVEFSIEKGDFIAVVGPNGSGKSTLVKAMLGLERPSAGKIELFGLPPAEALAKHSVGYLPQKSTYADPRFPATVREVVASGLSRRDPVATADAMDLLRVAALADLRIGTLSGGQQQRVHLARALVRRPEFLILDEPTGALDPESRDCFYSTLKELNDEGVAILIVSHDLDAVSRSAGKVLFLDRRMLYWGDIAGFRARTPDHYFGGEGAHRHAQGHDHEHH